MNRKKKNKNAIIIKNGIRYKKVGRIEFRLCNSFCRKGKKGKRYYCSNFAEFGFKFCCHCRERRLYYKLKRYIIGAINNICNCHGCEQPRKKGLKYCNVHIQSGIERKLKNFRLNKIHDNTVRRETKLKQRLGLI